MGDEIQGDEIWEWGMKFVGMKSGGDEIRGEEIWGGGNS